MKVPAGPRKAYKELEDMRIILIQMGTRLHGFFRLVNLAKEKFSAFEEHLDVKNIMRLSVVLLLEVGGSTQ